MGRWENRNVEGGGLGSWNCGQVEVWANGSVDKWKDDEREGKKRELLEEIHTIDEFVIISL